MTTKSKIEWTEATWNPIVGCTLATPGCTNCYAMKAAYRMASNPNTPQYHGTAKLVKGIPVWTGKINLAEKVLLQPLKRKKPTMYFVNSMGDLFHEDVPDEWIDRVFAMMALCPQHTFQVLTKRADRMREYMEAASLGQRHWIKEATKIAGKGQFHIEMFAEKTFGNLHFEPLPNVWLGVSVEDQTRAELRIPALLDTPAAVRFVSAEPLLGPVNFIRLAIPEDNEGYFDTLNGEKWIPGCGSINSRTKTTPNLDWIIVGGESGKGARPMYPDWARSIRDQCQAAGVPFFFKQWGEWLPVPNGKHPIEWANDSGHVSVCTGKSSGQQFVKIGKAAAGRVLDGREWQEMPGVAV